MSIRIHLFNGIIHTDPSTGAVSQSRTIKNGLVLAMNSEISDETNCINGKRCFIRWHYFIWFRLTSFAARASAFNESCNSARHFVTRSARCFYMYNAAASLKTTQTGQLRIGSYGDVVVLDKNPVEFNWKKGIPTVTMSILSGQDIYSKEMQNA